MLRGLPASIILHAAVIGAGYIVLPSMGRSLETSVMAVPIEIVDLSETTNIAPRVERDGPEPEPEEAPPRLEDYLEDLDTVPVPEPEEGEVEEEPLAEEEAPPPAPEEEVVPLPAEDEAPEPEPEPDEEEPAPEPDRPVLSPDPENVLDDILGEDSNLFDRTPRETAGTPPPPAQEVLEDETPPATTRRRGQGEMSGNTASVVALITSQMELCWDDVTDLPNPDRLNVTIAMELNRDGTLRGDARFVDPARPPIGDRAMQVAMERAIRAARRCAPYRLPEDADEYYNEWAEVTLNIGPAYKN